MQPEIAQKRLKVLHVTPYFHPAYIYGGPIESVFQLGLETARAGHLVRVLTTNADGPRRVLPVPPEHVQVLADRMHVRYCARVGRHSLAPTLAARMWSSVLWADVVHLTAVYSFPTFPTLFASRVLRKPVVWSPRGSLQRWTGSTRVRTKAGWEAACRLIAPDVLRLHVTSEAEAVASSARFPRAGVSFVPNGIPIREPPEQVPSDGALRLLYVGRLHPIKAIDNLLAACRELSTYDLAWSLTIAGEGEPGHVQDLLRLASASELAARVKLIGYVSGDQKEAAYANADVLILPSHSENFGLVVAEALAHGVPVIASKGTPWRRVEPMACGLWVDNSPASLCRAICQISTMPLRQMGAAGREWMVREFSWRSIAEQMLAVYRELIAIRN